MRLDGTRSKSCNLRDLIYRQPIHQLQGDACPFILTQNPEGIHQIHLEHPVARLGVLARHGRRIHVHRHPMASIVIIPHIVGDAVDPSGKARQTMKGGKSGVCLDKGILRQVITQLGISQRLAKKEATYR